MKWAYGVTSVAERYDVLRLTCESLRLGGFDDPRIFVDGYGVFGDVTRHPKVRTVGNWLLSAWELLICNPTAERFAVFQDDIEVLPYLRQYLDAVEWPERSYLNLYTYPPPHQAEPPEGHVGFYPSNQAGRGAVALCFTRDGLEACLTSSWITKKLRDDRPCPNEWNVAPDGHRMLMCERAVDAMIMGAMATAGYREFVHSPSLVQHRDGESWSGSAPRWRGAGAVSFPRGRSAMEFLRKQSA